MKKKVTSFVKYIITMLKEHNVRLNQIRKEIHNLKKLVEVRDSTDEQAVVIYAYRYLLNKEPENLLIAAQNTRNWRELQKDILQ